MDSPIITRFAPSPTGNLHLGHALAAWEARSLANRFSGKCVLRMEDIDQTRCRPEFVQGILKDLEWLGIRFDGPMMVQSSRFSAYEHALQTLKDRGVLYPCFCTRREIAEEVAAMGGAPQGAAWTYIRELAGCLTRGAGKSFSNPANLFLAAGLPCCGADYRSPAMEGHAVRRSGLPSGRTGDVILGRKDCAASYHIAVVVDDAAQGVTHVSRGEDLFPVTGIHRTLQALLGLPVPQWYHHRLVKDASGKRLAKRDRSLSLQEMRAAGMRPEDVFRLMRES